MEKGYTLKSSLWKCATWHLYCRNTSPWLCSLVNRTERPFKYILIYWDAPVSDKSMNNESEYISCVSTGEASVSTLESFPAEPVREQHPVPSSTTTSSLGLRLPQCPRRPHHTPPPRLNIHPVHELGPPIMQVYRPCPLLESSSK